jgi:hypothetical protein
MTFRQDITKYKIYWLRDRSLNMARGGMEEKLEILKKILGPPSKIICLFKAPLCILYFLKIPPPPPLVPLENIVLY